MRPAVASVLIGLIPALGSAANPDSGDVDRQLDDVRLVPIAASSLSDAEVTERCKAFIRAIGITDHVYQGGPLDFEPDQLAGFDFARIGSPAFTWAEGADDPNGLGQHYANEIGALGNPAEQWDKPLFQSDKATCLAVYEASQ